MFDFSAHLDLASKVILVKHATIACSNMLNAFFSMYQMKSDVLLHPDGRLAGAMKKRDRENDVWSEHTRLLQKTLISFLSNKIDKIEYLLFKAIMLCNPAVPGLSIFDQQVIEKERNQYMKALLNYCFLQHGTLNGPARFAAIIALAPVIEGQSKQQRDFHVWLKATHFHKHQKLTDRNRKCLSGMFNEIMES
uniref:NR LBD domain-containing protein n=1 Tax=Caenorhabditis japonica TaxID=281687 RepID=A0A8R1HZJ1_CAEJA